MSAEILNTYNLFHGDNICTGTAGICACHSAPGLEPQNSNKSWTKMISRTIHAIHKSPK